MFDECHALDETDWEIPFYKGLCNKYLRKFDEAIENFKAANEEYPNENTYLELGRVHQLSQNYAEALEVYAEGLNTYPENSELLTTIGLLYIRLG
jgi:Bardet-Biedl syndrome 4 protein